MSDSNAPQASPTIQELLDEIFKEQWPEIEEVNGFSNTKRQITTLFSRIITEAQPEKQLDEWNMLNPTDKQRQKHWRSGYNDAIDQYERSLRAAIAKGK